MSRDLNFTGEYGEAYEAFAEGSTSSTPEPIVELVFDMVNDAREENLGELANLYPANVEVEPDIIDDEIVFLVGSWHEEAEAQEEDDIDPNDWHDFSFNVYTKDDDVILRTSFEEEYTLTTVQALALMTICQVVAGEVSRKAIAEQARQQLRAPVPVMVNRSYPVGLSGPPV